MRKIILICMALASGLTACKDEAESSRRSELSGAALCAESDGIFDPERNECVCEEGFMWKVNRCEPDPRIAAQDAESSRDAESGVEVAKPTPVATAQVETPKAVDASGSNTNATAVDPDKTRSVQGASPKEAQAGVLANKISDGESGKSDQTGKELKAKTLFSHFFTAEKPSNDQQAASQPAVNQPAVNQPAVQDEVKTSFLAHDRFKTSKNRHQPDSSVVKSSPEMSGQNKSLSTSEPASDLAQSQDLAKTVTQQTSLVPTYQGTIAPQSVIHARVKRDCAAAGGEWISNDSYCHCASGRVLLGRVCADIREGVTRSVCARATVPGQWRANACRCANPDVAFSPGHGGCVQTGSDSIATRRRVCESHLNSGKWNAHSNSCVCTNGRIWASGLCKRQEELSSERVCESEYNKGSWNARGKLCECPRGKVWLDQKCRDTASVSPRVACAAEVNRGRWSDSAGLCNCPGRGRWNVERKRCI